MDYLKAMANIFGKMEVLSKVISNRVLEMVMAFGKRTVKKYKCIKVIMLWTKRQGMEFIYGKVDGVTRVIFKMTIVMDMASSMMVRAILTIVDFGKSENKVRDKL